MRRTLALLLLAGCAAAPRELPAARTPDEFGRETGQPLPTRVRPRPSKR